MEVLCWQIFYLIGGRCILFLRERGGNLEGKAILTKDEQRALLLHKTTKNTSVGQIYAWNSEKWEKVSQKMHRHKARLQPGGINSNYALI